MSMNYPIYRIKKQGAYYSRNFSGYTSDFVFAGKYSFEHAKSECEKCNLCSMELIDKNELINEINKRIEQLKDYLP